MKLERIKKFATVNFCLLFLSFLGGIFQGCQKEELAQHIGTINYDLIGIEHNKGLEYAFNQLKNKIELKTYLVNKKNKKIIELSESVTLDFCEHAGDFRYSNIRKSADRRELLEFYQKESFLKNGNIRKLYPKSFEKYLTNYQKYLLRKMSLIINNSDKYGENYVLQKFKEIEEEAINECKTNEKDVILVACSVAKYSFIYWRKKYMKWKTELGRDKIISQNVRLKSGSPEYIPNDNNGDDDNIEETNDENMDNANNVLYGDVYGAVSGFIYGAYVGGVSGTVLLPGVGTITGAIVGGLGDATVSAIMGSVGGAIWNIFDN